MCDQIDRKLKCAQPKDEYDLFDVADYIDNPAAITRLEAGITREELAKAMNVSMAYISEMEQRETVTPELLARVKKALKKTKK